MGPMPKARTKSRRYNLIVVLDHEDRAALEQVATTEKLTKSDTVRRLIRQRARKLEQELRAAG